MDTSTISLFLVACGILIALLSLWAQLWVNFGKSNDTSKQIAASYGLFWIYTAILFAMVAICLVLVRQYWEGLPQQSSILSRPLPQFLEELGFSFLITSFIMGLTNITESAVSIVIKAFKGRSAFESLVTENKISKAWLITMAILALAILIITWLGITFCKLYWLGYILVAISGVIVFIVLNFSRHH
jgi:hypothetical protein